MELLTTRKFNGVALDCYKADNGDDGFWATREQIGRLLEYENPREAIKIMHMRNKERLDKFSRGVQIETPSGVQTATVYNFKGFLEICRYSNQPKAEAVIDFVWNVMDEIRRTGSYQKTTLRESLEGASLILESAGLKDNQLTLALDKVHMSYMGRSALGMAEVELVAPTKRQILTPTEIGAYFGDMSAQEVNDLLSNAGYQRKLGKKWEPIGPGIPFAVMLDVNKAHSKGAPVRQLKWDAGILDVVKELRDESNPS